MHYKQNHGNTRSGHSKYPRRIRGTTRHGHGNRKTKMAIDCINQIGAKRILVICPKKAIPVWPYQFDLHSVHPFECVVFTTGNKQYSEKFKTEKKAKIIYSRVKLAEASDRRVVVILLINSTAWLRSSSLIALIAQ